MRYARILASAAILAGLALAVPAGDSQATPLPVTYSYSHAVDTNLRQASVYKFRLDWLDQQIGEECRFHVTGTTAVTIEEADDYVTQTTTTLGTLEVIRKSNGLVAATKEWRWTETFTSSNGRDGLVRVTYTDADGNLRPRWFIKPHRKAKAGVEHYDAELRVGKLEVEAANAYHHVTWLTVNGVWDVQWQSFQSKWTGSSIWDASSDVYVEGDEYTPPRLQSGG